MRELIWFIGGMAVGGSAAFLLFCLTVSSKGPDRGDHNISEQNTDDTDSGIIP